MGDLITTTSAADMFNTAVTQKIINTIVWYNGSLPNGYEIAAKFNPKPSLVTKTDLANLGLLNGAAINATILNNVFRTFAQTYTLIRKYHSYKYYLCDDGDPSPWKAEVKENWGTQIASLSTYYNPSSGNYNTMAYSPNPVTIRPVSTVASTYNIKSGNLVKTTDVTAFFNALYTEWNSLKESVAEGYYYYCHHNCHHNCHGNKGVGW